MVELSLVAAVQLPWAVMSLGLKNQLNHLFFRLVRDPTRKMTHNYYGEPFISLASDNDDYHYEYKLLENDAEV